MHVPVQKLSIAKWLLSENKGKYCILGNYGAYQKLKSFLEDDENCAKITIHINHNCMK